MSLKAFLISVLVVAAIGLGIVRTVESVPHPLGATPGSDFSNEVVFQNGVTRSNNVSTTSQGSPTVTAAEFRQWSRASIVAYSPGLVAGATVTLPASSTISDLVPKPGDTKSFCIRNSTTTAAVPLTLAGGTGTNLLVASSSVSALGGKLLLPGKVGCILLVRGPVTATTYDIDALLTVFQ